MTFVFWKFVDFQKKIFVFKDQINLLKKLEKTFLFLKFLIISQKNSSQSLSNLFGSSFICDYNSIEEGNYNHLRSKHFPSYNVKKSLLEKVWQNLSEVNIT